MKRYSLAILGASLFASATILTIGNAQEPKIGDLQDSIEVLTRGPLH
jgi:hypothetical protein